MRTDLLKKENVQILSGEFTWQEAIRKSAAPLVRGGYVQERYGDEIIKNAKELGPYFVLAPGVAMPHARPEQGVNETQLAMTLFREPVAFEGKEKDTKLFIVLAASDSNKHLDAMALIAEKLGDEEMIEKLCGADSVDTLYKLFTE
ncbi:MAG: PTS sugar transporter subunit IIA [Lachnospiraceae bacterium]|nr:PTS sugar transporter subunit IIA [Lachnospiraceae bacterium]